MIDGLMIFFIGWLIDWWMNRFIYGLIKLIDWLSDWLNDKLIAGLMNWLSDLLINDYVCFVQEDAIEETGWKLVHGDVFRPPQRPWLLTAFVGSGVQIFFMGLVTLGKFNIEF